METSEHSYRSRYGIDKLQDHNYHSWSWNCELLLREKEVWDIVTGDRPCPTPTSITPQEESSKAPVTRARKAETAETQAIAEWNAANDIAVRIITFTVTEKLQTPLRGKSAKVAWEELQRVHAPRDKQRKFSLIRRLYRFDMVPNTPIIEHENTFDVLVQSLAVIGKVIDEE